MLERKIASLALLLAVSSGLKAEAQDLSGYDPNNYSGGFAEGVYSPGGDEQLYPYDSQDQWQHGYIQYMPFYGAYEHFRPYNYKHIASQTQAASGWGMSPRLPYSQQFWHRYHSHAKMGHPASGAYENYLDIPVPKKAAPDHGYDGDPEFTPQPLNPQELSSPLPSHSVRLAPGMNRADGSHAGVSYQHMQPQPNPGAQHFRHSPQAVQQIPAQAPQSRYAPPGMTPQVPMYQAPAQQMYHQPTENPALQPMILTVP